MTPSSDRRQAARLAARSRGLGRLSALTAWIGLAGVAMAGVVAWALPGSKADSSTTTQSSSHGNASDDGSSQSSDDGSSQSSSGGSLVQAPSSQGGPQAVSGGS
jgi:hypothetical protein